MNAFLSQSECKTMKITVFLVLTLLLGKTEHKQATCTSAVAVLNYIENKIISEHLMRLMHRVNEAHIGFFFFLQCPVVSWISLSVFTDPVLTIPLHNFRFLEYGSQ